jgi:hypothetical protein
MEFVNDECNECEYYARPISNCSSWTCIVCGMEEIEIVYHSIPFIWHRYKLQCGHEVHERCYKVWCKKMNSVGCVCEIREKMDNNLYCNCCKNFGHSDSTCPIVRYLHVKQYIIASWDHYYSDYLRPKK